MWDWLKALLIGAVDWFVAKFLAIVDWATSAVVGAADSVVSWVGSVWAQVGEFLSAGWNLVVLWFWDYVDVCFIWFVELGEAMGFDLSPDVLWQAFFDIEAFMAPITYFFPLEAVVLEIGAMINALIAIRSYKFIKSWVPFVSGVS